MAQLRRVVSTAQRAAPALSSPPPPDLARGALPAARRAFGAASSRYEVGSDDVWLRIRAEARELAEEEPLLMPQVHSAILSQLSLECAVAAHVSDRVASATLSAAQLRPLLSDVLKHGRDASGRTVGELLRADLQATAARDPACVNLAHAFLFFKGFAGLQAHRVAHHLYGEGRKALAYALQSRSSESFGVDVHPAARLGGGMLLDHSTGLVIGETSVVGDNCTMLHNVTLGGTGKIRGDRHPKLGNNVVVGAGATILGNIEVGDDVVIAACSTVVKPVPPGVTVVGSPGRILEPAQKICNA